MQEDLQQTAKNMETRYFHILTFSCTFRRILLLIQGLAYLQYHIACSFTPVLLILIWLSFEKIEEKKL